MIEKIKNMDKKLLIYLGIAVGCVLFLIIFIIILKLAVVKGIDSKTYETRVKDAAISYYKDNEDELPKTSGDRVTISIDDLVSKKYLSGHLLKKGVKCSGYVSVNNNSGLYIYQPVIDCSDDYSTNLLYKQILKDSPAGTTRDGLYKVSNYYLFRGENPNNNVIFAGMNWKILRINNDNTIRMILYDYEDYNVWDNRYNVDTKDYSGKNIFEVSRIKDTLKKYFNETRMFSDSDKALIVPTALCIGSRNENSTVFDGSVECAVKSERLPLGLLQANEFQIVSLDPDCKTMKDRQCRNYNFLAKFDDFWTLTASSSNTYQVFMYNGIVTPENASESANISIVVNISENAIYSGGSGTTKDPYIIK